MDLMTWVVAWAVVTTAVVILALLRLTFGLHDTPGLKIGAGEHAEFYGKQQEAGRTMNRLDVLGIALTVVSALMVLVIIGLWAIENAGPA